MDFTWINCPFCSNTMENNEEAQIDHLRKYHGTLANPDTRTCHKCLQSFVNDANLLKHLSFHKEKHICPLCNKMGNKVLNIVTHYRMEHKKYIRRHWEKCFTCTDYFRAKDIASHIEECNSMSQEKFSKLIKKPFVSLSPTTSDVDLDIVDKKLDWLKSMSFHCVVCSQAFDCKDKFRKHLERHLTDYHIQRIECQTCGNSGKMKVDDSVEHEIRFNCQFCENILKISKKTNAPKVQGLAKKSDDPGIKVAFKLPLEIHLNSDIQVDSRPLKFVKVSDESITKNAKLREKVHQLYIEANKNNPDSGIKLPIWKNT